MFAYALDRAAHQYGPSSQQFGHPLDINRAAFDGKTGAQLVVDIVVVLGLSGQVVEGGIVVEQVEELARLLLDQQLVVASMRHQRLVRDGTIVGMADLLVLWHVYAAVKGAYVAQGALEQARRRELTPRVEHF